MTADGFLLAATNGGWWWTQPRRSAPGTYAVMQDDGNFVVYRSPSSNEDLWSTQTQGHDGAYLLIDDNGGEGQLTVRDTRRRVLGTGRADRDTADRHAADRHAADRHAADRHAADRRTTRHVLVHRPGERLTHHRHQGIHLHQLPRANLPC